MQRRLIKTFSQAFIRQLVGIGIFVAGSTSLATEQSRDIVSFGGQQFSMLERPLNDHLRRLPTMPRFDVLATSNWKGYVAGWEIKDSRLYLSFFEASTNGRPISVASLFPGRKLPILADWYSANLNLIMGKSVFDGGRFTFDRVTALYVTNGVVMATNEFRNIREDKLTK